MPRIARGEETALWGGSARGGPSEAGPLPSGLVADLDSRLTAFAARVVTPELKPRGYRKKRWEWTRVTGDVVHGIGLQRSHGNSADHLRIYVNVSAYSAEFARTVGSAVPDDLTRATPQYVTRFEDVVAWPGQWIDLEEWTDDALDDAFAVALRELDAHLSRVTDGASLAAVLRENDAPLDTTLFAWWCATGDQAAIRRQVQSAQERFGQEERWPRLAAQFERVATEHGVTLD